MGIEIQQWRSKIGSFYGICIGKIRLKNTLAMKPSCFDSIGISMSNFCSLISALLLLLLIAGDIEVNPGTCMLLANLPLFGNFHQGSHIFNEASRGKQCVPCCLAFFPQN